MKTVLMSIHPRWCKEIFVTKRKTIEVRKNRPRLETPFTVYVYQTKHKCEKGDSKLVCDALDELLGGGKVIGSFVCDWYDEFKKSEKGVRFKRFLALKETCLSVNEMRRYIGERNKVFGWHITEAKLFDKPKELGEFRTIKCTNKKGSCSDCKIKPDCIKYLTRPPQSWQYVEV